MHQKCGASYSGNFFDVIEPVLDQILENFAGLIFCDGSNRFEWRHQKKAWWIPHASQVCCCATTHASSEHYDIPFLDAHHSVKVIVQIHSVVKYIFFICVKDIIVIWLIWIIMVSFLSRLNILPVRRFATQPHVILRGLLFIDIWHRWLAGMTDSSPTWSTVLTLKLAKSLESSKIDWPSIIIPLLIFLSVDAVAWVFHCNDIHSQKSPHIV